MEEIQPLDLQSRLGSSDLILIDVRQPEEAQIASLPGAILIPLMEIPKRVDEIRALVGERPGDVVVFCRVGSRSQLAIQWLAQLGFQRLLNLRGGIDAYAAEVDPNLTRY